MVSNRPPTSKSSISFSNLLVTVPNAPITIGILVTSVFHLFLESFLHSILAVLKNEIVWMVSTRPFIFKSSSPLNNLLVDVPKAPIMMCINTTLMFHIFFNSYQGRGTYPSFHFLSVLFCGQQGQQSRQFCKLCCCCCCC